MSLKLNIERLKENIRAASTEDLMDRITFYKAGLELEAQLMIEVELRRRGVKDEAIEEWGPKPGDPYIWLEDGLAAPCSICRRPAVQDKRGWYRLWGKLPIFPRIYRYCRDHMGKPESETAPSNEDAVD